ncbi:hypothetical protein ES703_82300 [subsurface metagenome]
MHNKEAGYYDSYCWFEDVICDVCGEIIYNNGSKEHFESEQEFVGDDLATFCWKCIKLDNRHELIKFPM